MMDVETLPKRLLMVVAGIDILPKEILGFAERVRGEIEEMETREEGRDSGGDFGEGREVRVKVIMMERCFHGWLEVPGVILDRRKEWKGTREEVFREVGEMLREVHREHGWVWEEDQGAKDEKKQ